LLYYVVFTCYFWRPLPIERSVDGAAAQGRISSCATVNGRAENALTDPQVLQFQRWIHLHLAQENIAKNRRTD